jgi:mandelate racemase
MSEQSLRIRELRVRAVKVPMSPPHKTASGTITDLPVVLTDVLTNEDIVGHSYVFCYTAMALQPTALLVKGLEAVIAGQPVAPLEVAQLLAARFRLLGPQGLTGMAMAAVDMALWDALARAHEVPLARLLGATLKPIRAYGATGYDGADESARVTAEWAQRGFKGVKAKIGYPDVRDDVSVIRAMRRAAGDDIALMVDYNQTLSPTEAIARARHLDEEGLTWIEEPTLADDYAGHASVAREARTPIQCGENWWGTHEMRKAIDAGASDYMMPDVMKIGGVTGWLRAAALGEAHNIRLSNHLFVEVSTHLLCATPTADWLEYVDWFNPILAQPLSIVDGCAVLDERPGSGVEWNEKAIERYLVE